MLNVDSIWLKTKELLTYHYGYHSDLVTIAKRMWLMPIILRNVHTKYELSRTQDKRVIYITLWTNITKELLTYHCHCHGNLVTIATS